MFVLQLVALYLCWSSSLPCLALPCLAGYFTHYYVRPSFSILHLFLGLVVLDHAMYKVMSSLHRLFCRPLLLFRVIGCHYVCLLVHLLSSRS